MKSKLRSSKIKREIRKTSLRTRRSRGINSGVKSTSSKRTAGRKSKCYKRPWEKPKSQKKSKRTTRQLDRSSKDSLTWRMIFMKWRKRLLRLIVRTLSKIQGREISLIKMLQLLKRKKESNSVPSRAKKTSLRSCRIKSLASRHTHPSSRRWFTNSKRTSRSMVSRLQTPTLNTTSA